MHRERGAQRLTARFAEVPQRDAVARTARLRADPRTARVPILVVDLADVTQTPDLIRAGASDVGLAQIGDEALCAKLRRMIRRGR